MANHRLFSVCTSPDSIKAILSPKLQGLAKAGFDVTAISSPDPQKDLGLPESVKFVPVNIPRSISPFADLAAFFELLRLFKRERPHIVHTRTAKAGFIGRTAAWFAGVPIIIHTTHGLPFYAGQPQIAYCFYKILEKIAARFCDMVLSQNKEDHRRLIDEKIVPPSKTAYEGNGVNVAAIRNAVSDEKSRGIKAEFGLTTEELLIVSVARLEPVKHVDRLLNALAQIKDKTKWKCLIVGTGPLAEQLCKMSNDLGLADKVIFTGWRIDVWNILNSADIVVLTSDKEGIPRSVMEAMALAKPVVATDAPGTHELVVHGQTGLLSPLDNIKDLSNSIERLLKDGPLRNRLGHAGAKLVESEFDENRVIARLIHIYEQLLKQKNITP